MSKIGRLERSIRRARDANQRFRQANERLRRFLVRVIRTRDDGSGGGR